MQLHDSYKVRTNTFEGPLELLLALIEDRKLFVGDVSLAQVTDDYILYVRELKDQPREKQIADISYFILVAATLLLIKSKSLLPNLTLTEEEEEGISDLEDRLRKYQIIKNASIDIKNNFGTNIIFTPLDRAWNDPIFSPGPEITIDNIAMSIGSVLAHVPKPEEKLPEVEVRKVVNIEEIISSLTDRIQKAINISFREFAKERGGASASETKVNIIVSFLAMLELVREGIIDVIQHASFQDIEMKKNEKIVELENHDE